MTQERRTVTILFAGLDGFAALSDEKSPEDIVTFLESLFPAFRRAVEEEGGWVDKFIGETVMALFGARQAHEDDPLRAVRAALALRRELSRFNEAHGLSLGLRAGINLGEVWWGELAGGGMTVMGDPVNVAQRLLAVEGGGAQSADVPPERRLRGAPQEQERGAPAPHRGHVRENAGRILVSAAVEQLTSLRVRYRPLGDLRMKGRAESVAAFEVEGLREETAIYRQVSGVRVPMLGRRGPLAQLTERWAAARPSFLIVEGEAGVGKSRLLWEFGNEVEANGAAWLAGRCRERSPLPLEPFAEIVANRASVKLAEPEAWRRVVRRLDEDLLAAVPDAIARENFAHLITLSIGLDVPGARVKQIEPGHMAAEVRNAWRRWLDAVASRGPVLLLIEDLHWADEGTIALLEFLAVSAAQTEVSPARVARASPPAPGGAGGDACPTLAGQPEVSPALVARASPPAPRGAGEDTCPTLAGQPRPARGLLVVGTRRKEGRDPPRGYDRIELGGLDEETSRALVEAVFTRSVSEPLVRFLVGATGGNPYYLEELGRFLRERGWVSGDPLRLSGGEGNVPDTLKGLLVGRIDTLDVGAKEAIKGSSVMGRAFWRGVLDRVLERPAQEDVAALERREMVFRRLNSELPGEEEFAFKHALLRDAAYSLLTKKARAQLHAAVGGILETVGGARGRVLAASHWESAGDRGRAARLYQEASAAAVDRASYEEALEYATLAGSAFMRGRALQRLGRLQEALEAVREAVSTATDDVKKVEALLVATSVLEWQGALRESTAEAETARRTLGEARAGEPAKRAMLRVEAMRGRASALLRLGRHEEGFAAAVEAEQAARRLLTGDEKGRTEREGEGRGARWALAGCLNVLGVASYGRGEGERALGYYRESLAVMREIGDRFGIAICLNNIGIVHGARGEYDAAQASQEESLAIKREVGDRFGIATSLNNLGMVHRYRGDLDRALGCYEESLSIRREIGDRSGTSGCLNNIAIVLAARGKAAASSSGPGQTEVCPTPVGQASPPAPLGEGTDARAAAAAQTSVCARREEDYARARACLEESLVIARVLGEGAGIASGLNTLGNLHRALGEDDRALACHEEALAMRRKIGDRDGEAMSLINLGDVHQARGATARAEECHAQALLIAGKMGFPAIEAAARSGLGEALLSRGAREEGLAHLRRAAEIYRTLGMTKEAAEAEGKMRGS